MLNKTVNNGAAAKKSRMGRSCVREGEQLEVRHDAFLGDLLQRSISMQVDGAIFIRNRIRGKDKDPSFRPSSSAPRMSVFEPS